jgi:STE24 endopeptidase
VLVEPVFNDFEPLEEGPLRDRILAVADREGVSVEDVLVSDASRRTTTLNAYVSGFGSTRRVVLYDNTVNSLNQDQAISVVAHELAHAQHGDVLVGTGLGAAGAVFGTGLLALILASRGPRRSAGVGGPGDPGVVALVVALAALASLVSAPVQNGISRRIETRADLTALEATEDVGAFVTMQKELAVRSLSDPTPPAWSHWWFGSHPTTLSRVAVAHSLEVR